MVNNLLPWLLHYFEIFGQSFSSEVIHEVRILLNHHFGPVQKTFELPQSCVRCSFTSYETYKMSVVVKPDLSAFSKLAECMGRLCLQCKLPGANGKGESSLPEWPARMECRLLCAAVGGCPAELGKYESTKMFSAREKGFSQEECRLCSVASFWKIRSASVVPAQASHSCSSTEITHEPLFMLFCEEDAWKVICVLCHTLGLLNDRPIPTKVGGGFPDGAPSTCSHPKIHSPSYIPWSTVGSVSILVLSHFFAHQITYCECCALSSKQRVTQVYAQSWASSRMVLEKGRSPGTKFRRWFPRFRKPSFLISSENNLSRQLMTPKHSLVWLPLPVSYFTCQLTL